MPVRLISDEKIREVFEIVLDVAAELEKDGVQIYSFLITNELFDLIGETRFAENCEVLLDMIDTKENCEDEIQIIQDFLYDDD